jgi:hypothetical protein
MGEATVAQSVWKLTTDWNLIPVGSRDFSLLPSIGTASDAHPDAYLVSIGGSFLFGNEAGAYSRLFTAMSCLYLRKNGAIPPLPDTYAGLGPYLNHRDTFAFTHEYPMWPKCKALWCYYIWYNSYAPLFRIHFPLKCILLSSHPFSSLHVSAVNGHYQVSSILLKLLHCMSEFHIACERHVSWLN